MPLLLFLTLIVIGLGLGEGALHQRRLKKIPIRIHVNGTRGKSTTTRLIAGVLRQGGYRVLAKTTGTAAKLILEDGSEIPWKRKGRPSIAEQIQIVQEGVRRRVDVLVVECMALKPEMQWISERKIIQSTLGVITNVRADHLDEMGPTRADVASALALTIPRRGQLILGEAEFFEFFQNEAQKLGTETILTEAAAIPEQVLQSFPYLMFKENAACALRVGELLQIPQQTAWEGMRQAAPDPGSTQIFRLRWEGSTVFFLNALAANDLTSTLLVWEKWQALVAESALSPLPVAGVLHNRADRSFRVPQLVQAALKLALDPLWLTGDLVPLTKRYLKQSGFAGKTLVVGKKESPDVILNYLTSHCPGGAVLFAYGNTKGFGQELADYFKRRGERVDYDLTSPRIGSGF